MILSRRAVLSLSAAAGLSGCGAVSALSRAGQPLDTFTLTPLAPADRRGGGTLHLVVELPTSGGSFATDRILIKASPQQAQYLPGARWSEPTAAMVQTLLVNALLDRGDFRLVTRVGAGLMPDHTLMTEIQAFQAELTGAASEPARTRILMQMTLIRESDRAIVATRRIAATTGVASDSTLALIAGMDRTMQEVLAQALVWVNGAI
jgi:cholesterol transport system auxiliary component